MTNYVTPQKTEYYSTPLPEQLTMRDEFAKAALIGLIAEGPLEGWESLITSIGESNLDEASCYANAAYKLADAMMKAREL